MSDPNNPSQNDPPAPAGGQPPAKSYQALYQQYLPVAAALPAEAVQGCQADVRIAFVNIKHGIKSVCGNAEQIALVQQHLPQIPLDAVLEMPDIARALIYATGRVTGRPASPKDIEKAIQRISGPREQLLTLAEVLAKRGTFDKARVAKIRAGSGKYDMAKDGLDLAGLFTEMAAQIAGLHPFTADEIEDLRKTSEWLLEVLTPAGARTEIKKAEKTQEADTRDRLWTLLVQRHPDLRRIGLYFHLDEADEVTPRLQARVAAAQVEKEPEEDAGKPSEDEGAAPKAP